VQRPLRIASTVARRAQLILSTLATSLIVECLSPPFSSWPEALATFFGGQQLRRSLVCGPCLESVEPLGV
jgi:hypothetical protein